jgi:hypothetical protein
MTQLRHFYDLWESDADGFPIGQFGKLPEFCKPSLKEGNPSIMTYLDGWEVKPSGDPAVDLETGRRYAEETISYARKTGSSAFISFVLDAINLKTAINQANPLSAIELAFFDRLAQITYCGSMN